MNQGDLTLLIGGARAGKSSLAVRWGRQYEGDVTFIATARPSDDDMRDRIARHRHERPSAWRTIEEPHDLTTALAGVTHGLVIVDCLTLWTSNRMLAGADAAQILEEASQAAEAAADRADPTIVVSNEVGLSVHPSSSIGGRYRDLHGYVNQQWAATATRAYFVVAGRALLLSHHLPPWGQQTQ